MTRKFAGLRVVRHRDVDAYPRMSVVWPGHKVEYFCYHSRRHFKSDGYIIKVAGLNSRISGSQNDRELAIWNLIEPQDKKYFATIVAYGGRNLRYDVYNGERVPINTEWLVMPFYDSVKLDYRDDAEHRNDEINNRAYETVLHMEIKYEIEDLGDWEGDNWIICKNYLPKIIDYGWHRMD